jgi:AcrR family transcriptional regulator
MGARAVRESTLRDEVLEATWELIAEVGLSRVRIADIAERVGTSTGTIHYHFATKEDVLDAAFRYAVADSRRRSEEALTGLEDPWDRLVALLDAHMPDRERRREWVIWLQLWNEAAVGTRLRQLNDEHYGRWLDLVEGIVRDGQASGAFRDIDSRAFVVRLLTMMDGLVIQVTVGSSEVDLKLLRELLLGFAREQLLPGEAACPTRAR